MQKVTEILTSAQMRAVERVAIDSGAVSGLLLMECAGQAVLSAIDQVWPLLRTKIGSARILCGPGNNGGDGFVIARLLHDRGWSVDPVFFGRAERLPPDARANFDRLKMQVVDGTCQTQAPFAGDLSIDAVFGTGLARPIEDPALCAWLADHDRVTQAGGASVAVDIPSGLDADSGRVLQGAAGAFCARSHLTVAFHRAKPGHYLAQGPDFCGQLHIAGIGL